MTDPTVDAMAAEVAAIPPERRASDDLPDLLKRLEFVTDEDWNADGYVAGLSAAMDAEALDTLKMLTAPELEPIAFGRADMLRALNASEATRIMASAMISLLVDRIKDLKTTIRKARCAYCDWSYIDPQEDADERDGRIPTDEEREATIARVGAVVQDHVKICAGHPMRALETALAGEKELRGLIDGEVTECRRQLDKAMKALAEVGL